VERGHQENNVENLMPELLSQDSFGSDTKSKGKKEGREFYQQRSRKEVKIGENDGFCQTQRGQQAILPNRLGANLAYRDRLVSWREYGSLSVQWKAGTKDLSRKSSTKHTHKPSIRTSL
jgi:hypothetical protein